MSKLLKSAFFALLLILLFVQPAFAESHILSQTKITFPIGNDENNSYNANLAAQLITGYIIQPGAIFSFNDVVGPRTEERGFIYGLDASHNPDLGSGICREATVLYQAARDAGMEILERHSHYPAVDYAAPGSDAAIWWNQYDLKFKNTLGHPVVIRTAMDHDSSGHHLWAVLINYKKPTPIKVQSVVGEVYHDLDGMLINDKTYVPINQLADLYGLQYNQCRVNGIMGVQVAGHEFSELNDDLWQTSQGIAVQMRRWVELFGGQIRWWPFDNMVTLWTDKSQLPPLNG